MKSLNPGSLLKLLITAALLLLVLAWGYFMWRWIRTKKPVEATHSDISWVDTVPVVQKTLFREDLLPAEIESYQDVLIYPKVPGFIEWIGVDRGSVVRKDQLMVRMYAPEYLARRNEGLARVSAAKARLAAEESKL